MLDGTSLYTQIRGSFKCRHITCTNGSAEAGKNLHSFNVGSNSLNFRFIAELSNELVYEYDYLFIIFVVIPTYKLLLVVRSLSTMSHQHSAR